MYTRFTSGVHTNFNRFRILKFKNPGIQPYDKYILAVPLMGHTKLSGEGYDNRAYYEI